MTIEEQNAFLTREHAEAMRYMDNAKKTLLKAKKDDRAYTDRKYVRTACGTAYNGALLALDAWLFLKGVPKPSNRKRRSIEYYMENLAKHDKKLVSIMNVAYDTLHLAGYYDGTSSISTVTDGFDAAYEIIGRIKPYDRD